MRIRTKILFSTVIFAILALIVSVIVFQTANKANRFTDAIQRRSELEREVFELNSLKDDYLLRQEDRPYQQWLLKNEQVTRLLAAAQIAEQGRRDFSTIISEHDILTKDFFKLASVKETDQINIELRERLAASISLRSASIIEQLSVMSDADFQARGLLRRKADLTIYLLIAAFIVVITIISFYLYRSIILPLLRLFEGTERIARGDLSFRVGTTSQDEIGELSRSFDAMSARLMESYTELERKVAERTRDQEKFRRTVEDSTDCVVITDRSGNIVYVNKKWQLINGYSQQEVLGKRPGMLRTEKTSPAVEEKMRLAIRDGQSFSSEDVINRRKDGTEYQASVQIFPIIVEHKIEFFVGITQDISERKAAERMKTEFISLASHQLRTPVSAIRWFVEILLEDQKARLTPFAKDLVTNIGEINGRMNQLVNALLNISRIESGRLSISPLPTALSELVANALNELSGLITQKQLNIDLVIPKDLPKANIDPKLVAEVYRSLLTNAVKYTPSGGKVSVELRHDGQTVVSTITDSGIGIPQEEQWRVFKKFFRAANAVEMDQDGTGLGLYLAKMVVEASGGTISFSSEENKGSTFTFTLPLKGSPAHTGEVSLGK